MTRSVGVFLCALLIANGASGAPVDLTRSSEGWTYFNRPGATILTHDSDLRSCYETALTVSPLPYLSSVPSWSLAGFFLSAIRDTEEATRLRSNTENCMVVRGWRVVRVLDEEGVQLATLKPTELAAALSSWVGADHPHGEVVRNWDNDAAKRETIRAAMPGRSPNRSLSLMAFTSDEQFLQDMAHPVHAILPPRGQPSPPIVQLAQLDAVSSSSAVVLITMRDIPSSGAQLLFVRQGPDPDTPAWMDKRPAAINPYFSRMKGIKSGDASVSTLAFEVPPGRWILENLGDITYFCLGAPFFDVASGDVIYAGAFSANSNLIQPDMNFDSNVLIPAQAPEARRKVRSANWVNGAVSTCSVGYIYALEFPAAPYADGYRWGGAAPGTIKQPAIAPQQ